MDTDAVRTRLQRARLDLVARNAKVTASRRREQNPLGGDWAENAAVLENDEVLDALDSEGRARAIQLRAALDRLAAGTYGLCVRCRGPIQPARLEAIPEVTTCIGCARSG